MRLLSGWALAVLLLAAPASAQVVRPPADTLPPRATGLPRRTGEAVVLSGGGSRGLAHAGVLQGLEERGHDPDLVVGTSIGALVGALYAAGYPAADVQRVIREVQWGEVFTPAPLVLGPAREVRYPLLSFDRETTPLRFNRGFIPQWRINRTLARLLFDANARSRGDFDRLARRYRAVAADLETGDAVVLARGDLARAARASMGVPGVFAPVEWEGRSLVDGGIADNLPTDVARSFGRRTVIAVDVGAPEDSITGRNPFAVAGRALDLLQEKGQPDSVRPDLLIVPRLDPNMFGITFPADPDPLFAVGLAAARRDLPPGGQPARPRTLPPTPERFGALRVEAPDSAVARFTRRIFRGVAPGPYRAERVLSAVDRMYTTGLFEGVWPRVDPAADTTAAPELVVRVEALPRLTFAAAVGYDTDRGGRAWGSLQRGSVVAGAPAVLTASASFDRLRQWGAVSGRVYSVIAPSVVWTAGGYAQGAEARVFDDGERVAGIDVDREGAWIGAELPRLLHQQMAVAILRAERVAVHDGGETGFSWGPLVRYSTPVPREPDVGVPLSIEAETRWGGFAYRRVAAQGSLAASLGTLRVAAVAQGAASSEETPPDALPALGDEHAMPAFRWGEGRGRVTALAGADAAYPFLGGHLRARLRVGAVADRIGDIDQRDDWVSGAEIGIHRTSIFGVLSAAFGVNSQGRRTLFIDLGPRF